MIGRNGPAPEGPNRYGFNGKETDQEWGTGSGIQDYGFRLYAPGLGKFLSVDPLTAHYPWYTPYQFAGNKPIWALDLDGLEEILYNDFFKFNYKDELLEVLSASTVLSNLWQDISDPAKADKIKIHFVATDLKYKTHGRYLNLTESAELIMEVREDDYLSTLEGLMEGANQLEVLVNKAGFTVDELLQDTKNGIERHVIMVNEDQFIYDKESKEEFVDTVIHEIIEHYLSHANKENGPQADHFEAIDYDNNREFFTPDERTRIESGETLGPDRTPPNCPRCDYQLELNKTIYKE